MLNIAFASDDNYASLLAISMISLLENNKKDFEKINIFILDDGISEKNKTKLIRISKNYSCDVSFIKTKKLDSMNINILGIEKKLTGTSLTTYARLFIPTLIPTDIDKILYLDCDSLIVDSFKKLWEEDLTNHYCAGVTCTLNETLLDYFGFKPEDNYINAGVLLINLKKWREANVEEKFIEFLAKNQGKFYFHDQGAINEVFKNEIKIIEPKYNLQFYFQFYDYDMARKFEGITHEYYNKEIVDESRENPVFLHFCGSEYDRPWNNETHVYASEFMKYAKMADSEDFIHYIDAPSLKVKLFYDGVNNRFIKFLLKLIPTKAVAKIINKNALAEYEKERLKAVNQIKA